VAGRSDILLVEAQVDGGQLLEPHLVEPARRPAPAGARLPPTVDVLRVRCLVKLDDPAFCVLELARAWVREQHKPGDAMPIPESLHAMTACGCQ
jgi:hypothetical protein